MDIFSLRIVGFYELLLFIQLLFEKNGVLLNEIGIGIQSNKTNLLFQELRHSYNITNLSAAAFPAQEEVPEFPEHAVPLAHDLTTLCRVLLQALAYGLGQ